MRLAMGPLLLGLALVGCQRVAARGLVKEGNALYKRGQYEEALSKFEAAAQQDRRLALAELHAGYTALALMAGRPLAEAQRYAERAARAFSRYVALRPYDERGPRLYLQALLDAGRTDEALATLRREHARRPGDVKVVSSLGVVAARAGRFDEALSWYERQAALQPRDLRPRYMIGTACWQRLHDSGPSIAGAARVALADRGLAALVAALKLQPGHVESLTYVNLLYRERAKGQTEATARARDEAAAERYYRQALAGSKAGAAGR